jgi:hypothetical protein
MDTLAIVLLIFGIFAWCVVLPTIGLLTVLGLV